MNKRTIISVAAVGALVLALAAGYQAKVGKRGEKVPAASSAESGHAAGGAAGNSAASASASSEEVAARQTGEPRGKKLADSVNFLKVSPENKAAVIRTPDGRLQIVREGEDLGGNGLKLVEIGNDRVVMEEGTGKDKDTVIVRLDNGKRTVHRISKTAPASAPMLIPHTEQVSLEPTQDQSKN